ncbi:MAG: hypothetical protein CVV21_10910 [Candidatus Goldiibacteriota bacterium HGW-Goldbacteria-1]|jgi:TrmH family RNA methyltransferase|nr:MAG: hypothetical protein CVV21_10910 [Candidatus Goldiibacteriota bacterium HGW-Goldbacteria-1]
MDKTIQLLLKDKKAMKDEGYFIVDTEKILEEVLDAGIKVERFFYDNKQVLEKFSTLIPAAEKVKPNDISRFASVKTPAGFLALCRAPQKTFNDFKSAQNIILLDGIQDPSNLGAIIRSGAAFGFNTYILTDGCAGLYTEKTIRASAGAVFKVNAKIISAEEIADFAREYRFFVTDVNDGIDIKKVKTEGKTVLVFGSEGMGVSEEIRQISKNKIKIHYPGDVESLNVAAAAAVIFYEFSSK